MEEPQRAISPHVTALISAIGSLSPVKEAVSIGAISGQLAEPAGLESFGPQETNHKEAIAKSRSLCDFIMGSYKNEIGV